MLVRTHNPTAAMLARMAEWRDSLTAAGVAMHVSVDTTGGRAPFDRVCKALGALDIVAASRGSQGAPGSGTVLAHAYDEAEIMDAFPHLRLLRRRMVGEPDWAGLRRLRSEQDAAAVAAASRHLWRRWAGEKAAKGETDDVETDNVEAAGVETTDVGMVSIAWGFHAEAVALWWRCARSLLGPPIRVWVLEDDVGFTAPLATLTAAYESSDADLITHAPRRAEPLRDVRCASDARCARDVPGGPRGGACPLAWQGWCWHETCTDSYASLVPSEARLVTKEHAQRFSGRLLDEMASRLGTGCSA